MIGVLLISCLKICHDAAGSDRSLVRWLLSFQTVSLARNKQRRCVGVWSAEAPSKLLTQAFYLTTDEELVRWAQLHPEYSRAQVLALAASVADFRRLRRSDRAALMERVQAALLGEAAEGSRDK